MHGPEMARSSPTHVLLSHFLVNSQTLHGLRTELEKRNCFLCGRLFDDVVPALKELAEQGTRVYVFTSGCSDLQRLLFACSKDGDKSEVKFKYGCKVGMRCFLFVSDFAGFLGHGLDPLLFLVLVHIGLL